LVVVTFASLIFAVKRVTVRTTRVVAHACGCNPRGR
jgi:hypothetical protein